MKKHIILFAILLALVLTGCGRNADLVCGDYYRSHGSSDAVKITLRADGTYDYWETLFWGIPHQGRWALKGDTLCLNGEDLYFRAEGNALYYLADRSRSFSGAGLADGARLTTEPTPNYGTYYYDGEGFGGEFTITLRDDGTFTYYEGFLSSHLGMGEWILLEDNILCLNENADPEHPRVFYFRAYSTVLNYQADRSSGFSYVDLPDGAQFSLDHLSNEEDFS